MESEWIWWLVGIGTLSGAGLVVGLARYRLPSLAPSFRWSVTAAYVVLLVVTGVYVAACPDCTSKLSYDSARWLELMLAGLWGRPSLVATLFASWLGEIASHVLQQAAAARRRSVGS